MELIDMIVLGLLMILGIILSILAEKNRKLTKENALLRAFIENGKKVEELHSVEDEVKIEEPADAPSEKERIIALVAEGRSIEEVARSLQIPIDKVEMIIKFDRIKKEHVPS